MFGIVKSVFGRAGVYARALLTVVVALVALAAPSAAFALSAGCSAINALGGTFTVDGAGNGTDKFTDFASQPLANGEVVTYSWSGNTKGAYVYILYSQNSGFQFAPESVEDSTAVSGSGSFTFSNIAAGDFFEVGVNDDTIYNTGSNPAARNSTVNITLSCSAPTPPSLSINDVSESEGDTGTKTFTFTAFLSAASASTVTVNYATANGTATAGSDYTAVSGVLTFAPGETMKTVAVLANGDALAEPNETFFVNLSGATNATISDAQGIGTIVNDDVATPPTVSAVFNASPINLGSSRQLQITITNPTASPMTGVSLAAAALPANVNGSTPATNCPSATASYNAGTKEFSLSGGTLAAGASCLSTLTVTPTAVGSYTYTTGAVSAAGVTGGTATTGALVVNSPPTVTSISPTAGPTGGGTSVTLTGTNFTGVTAVTFGATAATGFTFNSATSITATAPAGSAGTVDVRVTTGGGTSATSAADQFTYITAPTVTSVSPTAGPTGGGTTVTITGTGFAAAAGTGAVKFGATNATYTINSNTQITATSPANSAGTYDITVTTLGGTSATSAADQYTYVAAPTVTSISPTAGPTAGGTTVTITGTGFSSATAVTFGATAATGFTVNSATQITATAPTGSAGTVDVRVTTVGGTSATSAADQFTYVGAPTVTSISPTAGPTGGGTSVTITGTRFSGATAVTFGATAATAFTVHSATQITATAPAGTGTVDVRVTTLGGTSATSAADQYTYVGAPTVTSISPTAGPTTGGTSVTITGTNFTGVTAVTFGATAATGFTFNSATSITATAPAGAAGTVDVRVTTGGGTSATSAADQFTYVGAPTVTAVTPTAGPTSGGTTVIITGTRFSGATAVTFGATAATGFTVNSATQITATAPAGAAGTVDVRVTSVGGTSATGAADQFTYVGAPTVTSISPTAGPTSGGTTVTITGTRFSGATAVTFGATAATAFTVNSASQITAMAPAGTGTVDIRVTSVGGTSATSAADQYTYAAAPTVTDPGAVVVAFNTATPIDLSGSISGSHSTIAVASGPSHGSTSISGDVVTYTPDTNYAGADSFTFTATGPGGTSATATVSLTVSLGDQTITFNALGNASLSASPLTLAATASSGLSVSVFSDTTAVCTVSGTSLTLLQTGTCTIRAEQPGDTTWAAAPSVSRSFTVTPAHLVITAAPASGLVVGQNYNQANTVSGGVAPYTYALAAGAFVPGTTLNTSTGVVSGTPTVAGSFSYIVRVTDSQGTPVTADTGVTTVTIARGSQTLAFTSTAPSAVVAGPAYAVTATANSGLTVNLSLDGTSTGCVLSGGSVTFTSPGTCVINANQPGDSNWNAAAQVQQSFAVIANPPIADDAPGWLVAYNSTGAPLDLSVWISGGAHTSIAVVTPPAHGTTSIAGDVVTYTPAAGYFGIDSFTYTATGPGGTSNVALVHLTVETPAAPAVTNRSGVAVAYNGAGTAIDLSTSITGVHASIAIDTPPAHGTVTVAGDVVTYAPAANYYGADSFTYTATGPGGTSAPATVSLTVANPPAPTVSGRSGVAVGYNSTGAAIDLSSAVSGVHGSIAVATPPAHGAVTIAGDVATYVPAASYFGPDSFTYTATGPGGTSAPATVSLTVATPPPPVVAPPTTPVVVPTPPAGNGPPQPVTVNLGSQSNGVIDGYRITATSQHGTASITTVAAPLAQTAGADGPQAAPGDYQLIYTPAANFMGTDTVTVVAFGPGGDSAPATFTFQVAGKAPNLQGATPSNSTIAFTPTAGLVGGPFQALRITRAPAFGVATVNGLTIVFNPGAANGGSTSLDYVIDLPFGASAAGRIDLVSNLVPGAQALTATTVQGRPVTTRISAVPGGPFSGAAVVSISPTTAGTATITGSGANWDLTFTPAGTFSGVATVSFTLTNAAGTTASTLAVTVEARPDPSQDAEVRGVATGQVTSARRFADAQISNFQRRLQDLHDGDNGSSNGVSLSLGFGAQNDADNDPRAALRRQLGARETIDPDTIGHDRDRDMLGLDLWAGRQAGPAAVSSTTDRLSATPPSSEPGRRSSVGFWTAGSVDWGRQDAQGQRDYRFTTQGVTAGLDVRVSDQLIVGGGLGYGEDKTKIGDQGSVSNGSGLTGALYASWRPAEAFYIDGVIGWSNLDFDSRRWTAGLGGQPDAYAEGERSGDTRFVSAAFGRILRGDGQTREIYARVDARSISLDGFTETGAGLASLAWDAVDQDSLSANLGAAWRWTIDNRRFGQLRPSARVEWSHEFEDIGDQGVRYADWAASPTYLVPLDAWSRDSLRLDLGADWSVNDRLVLGVGYRGAFGDASSSHGGEIRVKFDW